jgi:hypothetical protein
MAADRQLRVAFAALGSVALLAGDAWAFSLFGRYWSPRNNERPQRARTDYIVLHTTEGPRDGSLRKISDNGEANYLVDDAGRLYRIIDRNRVAFHAGRSMWNGKTDLDNYSVGIEVVGYHNAALTSAQYRTLKNLLTELQRAYGIPDERVLTHSMVAYGAPNRWIPRSHRGRKRCGMLFANQMVRQRLGLLQQPACDPDVQAGRLIVGDPYLARMLYGAPASTVAAYTPPAAPTPRAAPAATGVARIQQEPRDNEPEKVYEIGKDGVNAIAIAGAECRQRTTIYFLPNGVATCGDLISETALRALPYGTKMLVGYAYCGSVTLKRSAFDICGARWKQPSTFYRFPDGAIRAGNTVNQRTIPRDTQIFLQS